jgi:CheY-like chemotaxis protein
MKLSDQPRRILLIDDNADARELLAMGLEFQGHAVATADGGMSGLASAGQFRPDCIFLDLSMPGMNGYETALALRRIAGLALVTIVALSAWNDQATLVRAHGAGFDHHLTKPAGFVDIDSILRGEFPRLAKPSLRQASRHL